MPTRRYFSNFAPRQTLANSIGSADTSCQIAGSFAGWPTQFPFYATLGYGLSSAEIVSVTNIVGTTATIVRAQNGSVAVAHPAGETMDQTAIAQDFDEANAHASATSGVHGITGNVVGTTDAQTLTNKTLTAPTINGANIVGATSVTTGGLSASGPASLASLTVSGLVSFADGLPELNTTDWNTATFPGLYTTSTSANAPGGGSGSFSGLVVNVSGATQQIVWDGAGNEWRRVNTGTWSAWTPSANTPVLSASQATGTIVPTAGSGALVKFDTVAEDSHNGYSTSTGIYTTPFAGRYNILAQLAYPPNATGIRIVWIYINGVNSNWQQQVPSTGGVNDTIIQASAPLKLNAGDQVSIYAYQASGGNLTLVNGLSFLSIEYAGAR